MRIKKLRKIHKRDGFAAKWIKRKWLKTKAKFTPSSKERRDVDVD
jgi:hypothetical protein